MIARLLWALPILLFVIAGGLLWSAREIHRTATQGELALAEVVEFDAQSRAEITYGHVRLKATLPGGEARTEDVPLPLSLLYFIEGKDSVAVRILPESGRSMVVEEVARVQWRMSLIHAGMSIFGGLLLSIGVGAWNRYLKRHGDPGRRTSAEDG